MKTAAARYQPKLPAYEAFLKGRHFLMHNTEGSHVQAKSYLEKAIALDPQYAAPHAELAILYLVNAAWGIRPPLEMMEMAGTEAAKAFALAPEEPQAHVALGALAGWQRFDWNKAAEHFRHALAAEPVPSHIRGRYAVYYLIPSGRFEDARQQMEKALELDPLSSLWRSMLAVILTSMGRHEDAIAEGQKALELHPDEWIVPLWASLSYAMLGRLEEARRTAENAARLAPIKHQAMALLAGICDRAGDHDRARDLLAQLPDDWRKPMAMGLYHLQRDDIDAAAHCYEQAIGHHALIAVLSNASVALQPLRSSRHWPRLARMMNLPEAV